jgi:hypothetical protein
LHSEAYDDYSFCDPTIQEIYQVMNLWETVSAPLRRLGWHMRGGSKSPESSLASRGLLKDLMELSLGVLEETLLELKGSRGSGNPKGAYPWPPRFSAALMTLTKSAVASLPDDRSGIVS